MVGRDDRSPATWACHGSSHAVSPDARIGHEVTEPSDNFGRRTADSGRTEWRRVGGSQRRRITEGISPDSQGVKGVSCADVVICPIRNFLRVRGSADRRTLNWLWTASGQEIHDNVRVPDEIQKDLRASEWLIRSIQRRHGHRIAPCDFHTRVAPRSGGCASGLRGRSATDLPSNRSQAPRARRRYEKIARTAIRAGRFRLR